jgi:ADP-ribose 1''-phosphate phosphatase
VRLLWLVLVLEGRRAGAAELDQTFSYRSRHFRPTQSHIRIVLQKMPLTITEVSGDLTHFATLNAIIAHTCNCVGEAGAGVALTLNDAFPEAIQAYTAYCNGKTPASIVGQAVMTEISLEGGGVCYLANLLTSKHYGRKKDSPKLILEQTRSALEELRTWVEGKQSRGEMKGSVKVFSPKMNAGYFGVPWDRTYEAIRGVFADMDIEWTVIVRAETPRQGPKKPTGAVASQKRSDEAATVREGTRRSARLSAKHSRA